MALDAGAGLQAMAYEVLGTQRQVVRDAAGGGELVVAGVQEPLYRLGARNSVELGGEAGRGGAQRELLIDGGLRAGRR